MKITMPFEAPRPQSLEYTIDSYWKILTKNLQGLTEETYQNVFMQRFWHIQKLWLKTRDFWWDLRPETHDSPHTENSGPETQELKGGTQDPNSFTYLIGETWEPRPGTLKLETESLDP